MKSLILGLALLFVLMFTIDGGGPSSDFTRFLGRFHPAFVHLPIGLLLGAVLLEGLARFPRLAASGKAAPALLFVGAWSAILAALAGLCLAQDGGYESDVLAWHRRLGIATAAIATAAYVLKKHTRRGRAPQRSNLALMGSLLLTLAFAGHLGGTLTHGSGYLTRYMPDALRTLAGLPPKDDVGRLTLDNPEEAPVFDALIQPILDNRCVTCHNPSKKKGGLLLDTPEGLQEGGDDGAVVVAGRAEESALIRRTWLPLAHEDHMPPEGNPQLTVAEAELIRWWIDQGASFEQTLAEAEATATVQMILDGLGLDEIRTGIFALDVPKADSSALEALRTRGFSVMPLAEEEPFLHVRCLDAAACRGEAWAEALTPLAAQITWIDLGRMPVEDGALATIARLQNLTRLHLEQTALTDGGLAHLRKLPYLEYLNLYGTAVTDEGLAYLADLPTLRALYLWHTGVTEAGVQRLQQALPHLQINLGLTLTPPIIQGGEEPDA